MLLSLLWACQSGQVIIEKVDDSETEEVCTQQGELILDGQVDWFYWGGSEVQKVELVGDVVSPPCDKFVASSSADWLNLEIDDSGLLEVELNPEFVKSGHHQATISIWDSQVQEVLVEVPVKLSALVSPQGNERRRALVIGVDGMDGEEMDFAELPMIEHLQLGGQWTRNASTQFTGATSSGPGWTSILTGVEVAKHGVTSNGGYTQRNMDYSTFVQIAGESGISTSGSIQWDDVFEILEQDVLDASFNGGQQSVTDWMVQRILTDDDGIMFVHLDDVDIAGHASGFSRDSETYISTVEQADVHIGDLFEAILNSPNIEEEEWLIIVTSDHGGDVEGTHGTRGADYRQIPLVVAGPSVPKGKMPTEMGSHMDTFSTVLDFLGLGIDYAVDGVSWMERHEGECGDGIDNDEDGLIDCDDSDCIAQFTCQECQSSDLFNNIGTGVVDGLIPLENNYSGSCGGSTGEDEIFLWTPPISGVYVADTMDWYRDTVLYVYDGECSGEEIICNSEPNTSQRSVVVFDAEFEQTVSIVIDTNGDDSRETGLSIYPQSDACASTLQDSDSWSGSFSHVNTSYAGGCVPMIGALWWEWVAPEDGIYRIDTEGSDFDTVLYVLDGCAGDVLLCNDDFDDLYAAGEVSLLQGDVVSIGVGSFAGRVSSGLVSVSIEQN